MLQVAQAAEGIRQSLKPGAVKEHQVLQIDQVDEGLWQPFQSFTSLQVYSQQLDLCADCCWQSLQSAAEVQVQVLYLAHVQIGWQSRHFAIYCAESHAVGILDCFKDLLVYTLPT